MCPEPKAGENSPTALAAEAVPHSPWRVAAVQPIPEFRLRVSFVEGLGGIVGMSALVRSSNDGVFAALADPALFAQAQLEYGAVTWPGDLDLAPDSMHAAIQERGMWVL
jgi:hypothetical protein